MYHQVLYSYAGIATQILVKDDDLIILLDVGDGILRDLLGTGVEFPTKVPWCIFITHGHYDHCGGLFSLLGFFRMLGQTTSVNIYFPHQSLECRKMIKVFRESYTDTTPFSLVIHEIKSDQLIPINNSVAVKPYPMVHYGSTLANGILAKIPAYGYAIFKNSEKELAYSGDTGINPTLEDLVSGANHAYIEATYDDVKIRSPYHLNIQEAKELGSLAKNYTLIHKNYVKR
ncbi:MAG: MBL fold metallo-hydrolase [Candidatus Hodarchaeales archaeon]